MVIWVQATKENYRKRFIVFSFFGLPTNANRLDQCLTTDRYEGFSFGRPPMVIDSATSVQGVEFDDDYPSVTIVKSQDIDVKLTNILDLVKTNKASGRYTYFDDLVNLIGHEG